MMKRLTLGLLVAGLALAASACEHGIDMTGTVIVPAEVQAMFSPEQPGQLLVVATLPGPTYLRDQESVFCMSTAGERRIEVRADEFGCASGGTMGRVEAFAIPRSGADVDCGAGSVLRSGTLDPLAAVAKGGAEVGITTSDSLGACSDGHVSFEVTLRPVSAP